MIRCGSCWSADSPVSCLDTRGYNLGVTTEYVRCSLCLGMRRVGRCKCHWLIRFPPWTNFEPMPRYITGSKAHKCHGAATEPEAGFLFGCGVETVTGMVAPPPFIRPKKIVRRSKKNGFGQRARMMEKMAIAWDTYYKMRLRGTPIPPPKFPQPRRDTLQSIRAIAPTLAKLKYLTWPGDTTPRA